MTEARATLLGAVAVLLWALLALLTVRSGATPPFQLTAMALGLGAAALTLGARLAGRRVPLRLPAPAWALGAGGIAGYHLLYFTALRNAPAAEAGLVAYLWPLLIVLFSGLLPGERLGRGALAGAALAALGAGLVLAPGLGGTAAPAGAVPGNAALGFAAAGACALVWSGYSVLSRRFAAVPSEAVAPFCAVGAIAALGAHLALEPTVWPATAGEWAAVAGLGLGPLGLAFLVWDIGVKRGRLALLGTLAYAAPVLSTLVLGLAGEARLTPSLLLAAGCVAGGAALAARRGRAT